MFLWSSGNKRKQIIQVVQYLDERLRELDEEKEELKKYQQLDKQRRSLEYTIYEKELSEAKQKLEDVSHVARTYIISTVVQCSDPQSCKVGQLLCPSLFIHPD